MSQSVDPPPLEDVPAMRMHLRGLRWIFLGLGFSLTVFATLKAQEPDADATERKVMERFQTVLEKTPRRGTALDRVYGYHVEHGSLDALVKRYKDRTDKDPKDGPAWLLLGLIEAQRGKDASAVAALREAEKVRPNDPLPPFYLGQALVLVGQPDVAVDAFERALTRRPIRADLLEIYQSLGRVHQRARRADKALAVWGRLEASFPDDTRVREQIAAALAEEDQPAQALIRYEALAKDVKDEYQRIQMGLEAAELKVRLGKAPEALVDFERLLGKLNPDSWLFKEVRRKIEEVFLRNDDLAGLAKYYDAWITKTPDDVEAMARLGRTYAQLGRAPESRLWLDKAVKLAPSRRDLRVALIEQLVQEKKIDEASAQYELLAKAEPGNPDVLRDWGRLLLRDISKPEAARKAAAADVWKRLAGDDVKDAVVIAQAADLFRQAEMVDEAIGFYKRAISLAPDSAQYREYLGEYYHQLKRPVEALATWRTGVGKTAAELGRLGEVLAGFGYRKEALEPLTDAVKLAPEDFDLRLKLADLLLQLDRPLDSLKELAAASKASDSPEQAEAVLTREIKAYQGASTLVVEIGKLNADLGAGKAATAPRWTRLARYYEADGKPAEAIQAITKATVVDPKSLEAWTALARLQETSGNLTAAADANRKLATLDRKSRADYLSAISRLEARLGRKEAALAAGRELLAAAPGNVEHHQEFAELCFSLGEIDEGLEALRRASRANPSDPKATNTLADALARQFRTEEAIELYWRSFDRTKDLEAKLQVVSRLVEQYLQRNQFDRLVARIERELHEPDRKRELVICLAQAYQAAGDLGTARQQLESLLTANPRDTGLLIQLANLSESEGDLSSAAQFQKQAVELAPSPEGMIRLAQFYIRAGEVPEAEAVWAKLASGDQDASRTFSAVDSLLASGKNDTVLTLTERMLLKQPGDWEALYREGVALINLNKPLDAAKRFQSILDLHTNDDDMASVAKARRKGAGASRPAGVGSARMASAYYQFPMYQRINAVYQIRAACKLDNDRSYGGQNSIWTPGDFGQARMAALAWLYAGSLKAKEPEVWMKARQAQVEGPKVDPRVLWDWHYLKLIMSDPKEIYATALKLVRVLPNDLEAQYAFLSSLNGREGTRSNVVRRNSSSSAPPVDKTPPLAPDELELVLDGMEVIRKQRPELLTQTGVLNSVDKELKRAKRDAESEALYHRLADTANTVADVSAALLFAGNRGDVDGLISLADKYERLQSASGNATQASRGNSEVATAIAQTMGAKAEIKNYPSIIKMLDYVLALARRPEQVARRLKSKTSAGLSSSQNYYMIYTTKVPVNRYTTVDFPTANIYFDYASIYILRNTFEIYKKADLTSDLIAKFRTEMTKGTDDAKLYSTLALSYLLWWNDDKDEALREYSRATELAKNDVELRLSLADLRAQRGEPAEALEAADSVEPLDQRSMQRREMLALRLSVLSGDVQRARQAAERLFGLRLDGDTQVQLATQMNQLGMHDLAEAVLARARRRAGGNSAALVGLMLQYQRQGKTDVAVQVANQILRQSSSVRSQPGTTSANDQARSEAVQIFARSGKLKELIARAEAQLAASPTSLQLLQTLVEYYQADGQQAKVKSTYNLIGKLRPDDAKLQFQIGTQLSQSGAAEESLEHFRAALKKEPALLANQYWVVQQAFQQANKMEDLVKLYESMDFKSFSNNPYVIQNVIQQLIQEPKNRDQALTLFRKAWKEMPESRAAMLTNLYRDEIWALPEIFEYAREGVIPPTGKPVLNAWAGLDQIDSWSGDGRVNGVLSRLVEAASRQSKLDSLATDVDAALKRSPEWTGGRALAGVIKARRGKIDEARKDLEALLRDDANIPSSSRMLIGQELDKISALKDLEVKFYEGAMADDDGMVRNNGFQYGPGKRLAMLYQKSGRTKDARDLVLKAARAGHDWDGYDAAYGSYRKIQESMQFASLMYDLGFPADAARFYSDVSNDSEAIANASQYYGGSDQFSNQIRQGLARALEGMSKETMDRTIRALLSPIKLDAKAGEPILDLVLLCHPRDLDKSTVTCLFAESIKSLKADKALDTEVHSLVAKLLADHPADLSVLSAAAILAGADGKAETLLAVADRLLKVLDSKPLDVLAANARPNARQRDEAAGQLLVWAVARECAKFEATRSLGDRLAARAIEAARRQSDMRWSLAMLRETGQKAFDCGDRGADEQAQRAMLKLILTNPAAAAKPAKPAPTRAATSPSGAAGSTPPSGSMVVTMERFDQAVGLAKLAASHDLTGLSIEAIREALATGPPVVPIAAQEGQGRRIIRSSRNESQADPVALRMEEHLFELDRIWSQKKADPQAVYAVLKAAVLPGARPTEIFLYPRTFTSGDLKPPRSGGVLLARWAVKANQADDLRKRIEAREASPLAKAPARVLLAQLSQEQKNHSETNRLLDSIREGVAKNGLSITGEQACLVALPALEVKETGEAAAKVIASSLDRITAPAGEDNLVGLRIILAQYQYKSNRPAEGRKLLLDYLTKMQQSGVRYGGDYSLYLRRQQLARVATEFSKAGQLDDALDLLGQYTDAPISTDYGDDGGFGTSLAESIRLLMDKPLDERYRRLKAWTFPTADRKSIRWLVTSFTDPAPPAPFKSPIPVADRGGLVATPMLLIQAAKAANQLEALASEIKPLVDQKVEHALDLSRQIDLARGKAGDLITALPGRLDALIKKPPEPTRSGREVGVDMTDYLLVREALGSADPKINDAAEGLARKLILLSQGSNWWIQGHLRRDLAEWEARRAGAPDVATHPDAALALWTPIVSKPRTINEPAQAQAIWAESNGVVGHVTGIGSDYLLFRYPLTGRFEVSIEAYTGSHAEGQIGYGGFISEPSNYSPNSSIWTFGRGENVILPGTFSRGEAFNRMSIQVEPGKISHLVNDHLFYADSPSSTTSPWLVLHASRERHTAFRNAVITGHPEIPREVLLCQDNRLEGWETGTFNETSPLRRAPVQRDASGQPIPGGPKPEDFDWSAANGEIRGRLIETQGASVVLQSRIAYARPLEDGESITYEFFYSPDRSMVHPALGQLAFLIEPTGVKLHAITTNFNTPGLEPGNVLDDPSGRREPVSLKTEDWNAATLRLKGHLLTIEINGKPVYERDVDPLNRIFSFYHDKARTKAQARKIVLKGDWPKTLTPDQLANLFIRNPNKPLDRATRLARATVIGERFFVLSARELATEARKLPAADRYAKLIAWVLPSEDHSTIRLASDYSATDPIQPDPTITKGTRVPVPGKLISPAIDLIQTATELGKLDELAKRIGSLEPSTDLDRRGRLALLAMVLGAQNKPTEAEAALVQLRDLAAKTVVKETLDAHRWPELVAGSALAANPRLNSAATSLLGELVGQTQRDGLYSLMERRLRNEHGIAWALGQPGAKPTFHDDPRIPGWIRGTIGNSESNGLGFPLPTWTYHDGTWKHIPGHQNDMLFLATPLRGDFELNCELSGFNWREARISYAGVSIGARFDHKSYEIQHYGRWLVSNGMIDPPLKPIGDWYPFRLVVKNGTVSAYAQGQKIHEQAISSDNDPWLAIFASGQLTTQVRNIQISGKPVIPERITLSGASDLSGWLGDYYGEATQGEAAVWQKRGDEIIGRRLNPEATAPATDMNGNNSDAIRAETLPGSKHESLLRYARPLAEDGELNYEFFYDPGQTVVHPALGRMAFLFDPNGIKIHRITDGKFSPFGTDPGQVIEEPTNRKGPAKLPLKIKDWNRVSLTLKGEKVLIRLNDQIVYEKSLEPTNQREFSFFTYADESSARIRNVTYQGDWPRSLPSEWIARPATALAR